MRSIRHVLTILGMTGHILIYLSIGFAQAQNFADLKSNEVDDPDAKVQFIDSKQPVQTGQPMQSDAAQDGIKNVMKPEEYTQFMAAKAYVEKTNGYTLGPTDIIEITVLRHPEVSGTYTINNEGKIQFEFVGDVEVSGLTKEKVAEHITKMISTYIVNPQVTVKITGYNSKIVYVVGEVANPGKIFMRGDTITVREALLEAGLPLLSASTNHASMFTPSNSGKVERRIVDVESLLYKGDLRQDHIMRPGDTLYLPPTFWAKAMRVISPITQPVGQAASTGATVTTGF